MIGQKKSGGVNAWTPLIRPAHISGLTKIVRPKSLQSLDFCTILENFTNIFLAISLYYWLELKNISVPGSSDLEILELFLKIRD